MELEMKLLKQPTVKQSLTPKNKPEIDSQSENKEKNL